MHQKKYQNQPPTVGSSTCQFLGWFWMTKHCFWSWWKSKEILSKGLNLQLLLQRKKTTGPTVHGSESEIRWSLTSWGWEKIPWIYRVFYTFQVVVWDLVPLGTIEIEIWNMKLVREIFENPTKNLIASSSYIPNIDVQTKRKTWHALWPSWLVTKWFYENPSQKSAMLFSTGGIILPTLTMHY